MACSSWVPRAPVRHCWLARSPARRGRLDGQVVRDRPDINGRRAILDVHSKGKPIDRSVDIAVLAKQTPGFSGADLANLVNEAAILAARRNKKSIGLSELEE